MTLVPERLTDPVVVRGLYQVAAATALAAVVIGISSLRDLGLERELGGSFVRGFVQVIAMGALIGALFTIPLSYSGLLLAAMVCYAAWESRKRGDGVPNAFRISVISRQPRGEPQPGAASRLRNEQYFSNCSTKQI